MGVLLVGPSGIGKSECALELVQRGHRLVADDVVRISRSKDGQLRGSAPGLIRHYMEIRGIGLLYIPDLYGKEAVKREARVELVCRIEGWQPGSEFERVGLERPTHELAGVSLPALVLPARPASSMATLVEVAVRDHRHRRIGISGAQRLDDSLRSGAP